MKFVCFILLLVQIASSQIITGNKRGIGAGAIPPDVSDSRLMGLSDWNPSTSETANTLEAMLFTYSQFTQESPMPIAAADACTVLYQNKLYTVGGYGTSSTNYLNNLQIFNPQTKTWSQGATKTTAEWGAGCAAYNGKLYVFGGTVSGNVASSNAEVYDLTGNTWSALTSLPAALGDGTMAVTVGSFIYILNQTTFYKFDPSGSGGLGSYTTLTSPSVGKIWSATGYVNVAGDDRIYYLAGSSSGTFTNSCYYYSVTNGTWSAALATAPYSAHGMMQNAVYNGNIYFLGGYNDNGGGSTAPRFFQDLYAYTPGTNTWSSVVATMNAFRDGVGGGFYGNKLYAIGGRNASNAQSPFGMATVESYQIGSSLTALNFTDIALRFKGLPTGNARMGLYTDAGATGPGTLIFDSGSVLAISGFTDVGSLSQTLTPGNKYWLTFVLSSTNTLFYSGGLPSNPSGPSGSPHCFNSFTFGSLPSTFPTSGMTCNASSGQYAIRLTAFSPITTTANVVQACPANGNSGSSSTISCTFSSPVGAHHAIIFEPYWGAASGTISSTSDTLGSSWTTLASGDNSGSFSTGLVYTCDTGAGGSDTITVTLSSSQAFRHWVGIEISGASTSGCVAGTSNLASGTAAVATSASVAIAQPSLLVGFFGDQAGVTWTPGTDNLNHYYSTLANTQDAGVFVEALQQPTIGTYLANTPMSASSAYHGYMVVVK